MRILRDGLPLMLLAILLSSSDGSAYTLKTIHAFCALNLCADGATPYSDLVPDSEGNLYGTASRGGAHALNGTDQAGVVFEIKRPTKKGGDWRYFTLYSFCAKASCTDGAYPTAEVVVGTSGNLYGTTQFGGKYNHGTVFELSPNGARWKLKTLHHFCGQACKKVDGADLQAGITYAGAAHGLYDGHSPLFGATYEGGKLNAGTIFEIAPESGSEKWSEKIIADMCTAKLCILGNEPLSTPMVDDNGNLFGTANLGGNGQSGTAYELIPDAQGNHWTQVVLNDFGPGSGGSQPAGSLVLDSSGNLLGTTEGGGAYDWGAIFKLTLNAKDEASGSILYNFCPADLCVDGGEPQGRVVLDSAGNMLVLASEQGQSYAGAFVKISPTGQLLDYYDFCSQANCADGSFPAASVFTDETGIIIGTASSGGPNNLGTVFELIP